MNNEHHLCFLRPPACPTHAYSPRGSGGGQRQCRGPGEGRGGCGEGCGAGSQRPPPSYRRSALGPKPLPTARSDVDVGQPSGRGAGGWGRASFDGPREGGGGGVTPPKCPAWAVGVPYFFDPRGWRSIGQEARMICLCVFSLSSGRCFGPRFRGRAGGGVVMGFYSGMGYT